MTALSETVHVEGGGERAIKSLPEQAGMTHTTEFIQEGGWERGKQKREEERPASSSRFKIISGNKPKEEAVVQPYTLIPQHGPKPCQRGSRDRNSPSPLHISAAPSLQ